MKRSKCIRFIYFSVLSFLKLHIVVVRLIVVLEIVGIFNYNLHWLHGT